MNPAILFVVMVFVTISNAVSAPNIRPYLASELSDTIGSELASPSFHESSIASSYVVPDSKRMVLDSLDLGALKRSFDSDESRPAAPVEHPMKAVPMTGAETPVGPVSQLTSLDDIDLGAIKRSFDSDESRRAALVEHPLKAFPMPGAEAPVGPVSQRLGFGYIDLGAIIRSFDSDGPRRAAPVEHPLKDFPMTGAEAPVGPVSQRIGLVDIDLGAMKRSFDADEGLQGAPVEHSMKAFSLTGAEAPVGHVSQSMGEVVERIIAFLVHDPSSIRAPLVNDDMDQPDHPTKKALIEEEAMKTANKAPEMVMPLAEPRYLR